MLETLFWLLVGHAVADYPLQGDFLARGKNHRQPLPGVPWSQCLMGHCTIHAGAVALVTGVVWLGLVEYVVHWCIDWAKCEGLTNFNTDQALHVVCKVLWVVVLWGWVR